MSDYYRRLDCRACLSKNIESVLQLVPTSVGDHYVPKEHVGSKQPHYPLELFLCRDCGLAQLCDVVSPSILYGEFTYETSVSVGLPDHFRNYAEEISEVVGLKPGSYVIDIGSNDGTLLSAFKQRGMTVLGIDPARAIAEKATKRGIETIASVFSRELADLLVEQRGKVDLVVSNNTMANIDDLHETLTAIRSMLKPSGTLILETGYLRAIVEQGLWDTIYHEHISYFSVKSLDKLLRSCGLQTVNAWRVSTKGGSIRLMACSIESNPQVDPNVSRLIKEEDNAGCHTKPAFNTLQKRIETTRDELRRQLAEIKAQGKSIAGYGASVGSTTSIYFFGLQDFLDFVVDDNPIKHNKFSPGHHIPVLSPDALLTRKPDYTLIISWRYVEPIRKKNQAYVDNGGKFLSPWPEVKLVP